MPAGDSNATVCINTGLGAQGPPLELFLAKKQGGARGDEGSELSCKRTESKQCNSVRN
jgi:hypothetical protein